MKKHIIYILSFIAGCFMSATPLHADNALSAEFTETEIGLSWNMDIVLHGTESNFTAFQLDITLPSGVSISEGGPSTTACTADHTVLASTMENGAIRIVGYSTTNSAIIGAGSRSILSLRLQADTHLDEGNYSVSISTIRFALRSGSEVVFPDAEMQLTSSYGKKYTLTYWVDEETYFSEELQGGATITPPTAPEKKGHTFIGWKDLPSTMPTNNVDCYAQFEVNTYIVTYYLDGKVYSKQEVAYGAPIVTPEIADTDEQLFNGWQDVPTTMPDHDVNIYGSTTLTGIAPLLSTTLKGKAIYDLSGRKVRNNVTSLKGLPRGIYLIGGEKIYLR